MTNRIKLFTESVSQMGIGMPEAAALTKLFKACLESAFMLDDEENKDYVTDTTGYDFSEDDYDTEDKNERPSKYDSNEEIDELDTTLPGERRDNLKTDQSIWRDDDIGLNTPPEQTDNIDNKSNVGTSLANTYVKFAPKLLDMNICTFDDISNMYQFIDWLIHKSETFDYNTVFQDYTEKNNNKSYAAKMDRILDVVTSAPKVVQLLKDIKDKFSAKLTNATIVDDSTVFALATDINNFVATMFSDDKNESYATDDKLFTAYSLGYSSQSSMEDDADYASDLDDQERMAAEENNMAKNYEKNTKKKETNSQQFDPDCDIDDVNDEVEKFVNVVPTFGLTDAQSVSLNKPSSRKNKTIIKQIAAKLDSLKKETRGGVVNAAKIRKKASKTFDDVDF